MPWEVTGQIAKISCIGRHSQHRWTCQFDLTQPHLGLAVHRHAPEAGAGDWHLLKIRPAPAHACTVDDWFARGSDLMVRYAQSETERFAFQIDFRRVPEEQLGECDCGWDVWLSVQTQLLDAHPALEVSHAIPGGQWSVLPGSGGLGAQPQVGALFSKTQLGCMAMLVHPSDQPQTEWLTPVGQSGGSVPMQQDESGVRLLGDFMEKGVIRRARLRCLWSGQPLSAEQLADCMAEFAECPLPLTA
jgi:hypothetical protein